MMSMSCFGNRDSMAGYLEDSRNFKRIQEYRAKKLLNIGIVCYRLITKDQVLLKGCILQGIINSTYS